MPSRSSIIKRGGAAAGRVGAGDVVAGAAGGIVVDAVALAVDGRGRGVRVRALVEGVGVLRTGLRDVGAVVVRAAGAGGFGSGFASTTVAAGDTDSTGFASVGVSLTSSRMRAPVEETRVPFRSVRGDETSGVRGAVSEAMAFPPSGSKLPSK